MHSFSLGSSKLASLSITSNSLERIHWCPICISCALFGSIFVQPSLICSCSFCRYSAAVSFCLDWPWIASSQVSPSTSPPRVNSAKLSSSCRCQACWTSKLCHASATRNKSCCSHYACSVAHLAWEAGSKTGPTGPLSRCIVSRPVANWTSCSWYWAWSYWLPWLEASFDASLSFNYLGRVSWCWAACFGFLYSTWDSAWMCYSHQGGSSHPIVTLSFRDQSLNRMSC